MEMGDHKKDHGYQLVVSHVVKFTIDLLAILQKSLDRVLFFIHFHK